MKLNFKLSGISGLIFVALAVLFAAQSWAKTATVEEIAERLRPAGELCVQGMDCGGTVAPAVSAGAPKTAQQVYASTCTACHDTGVVGSPKLGDKSAWSPRLSKGVDALYQSSLKGLGAMPPKGGNLSLSDAEVKSAVDYMLEAVR